MTEKNSNTDKSYCKIQVEKHFSPLFIVDDSVQDTISRKQNGQAAAYDRQYRGIRFFHQPDQDRDHEIDQSQPGHAKKENGPQAYITADISKIPDLRVVIPKPRVKYIVEHPASGVFHDAGHNHTEEKYKQRIILEAIDQKRGIECDYYSFNKKTVKHQLLIPYFMRTWENRWYVVAEPDNHHHGQSVFALERMDNIRLTEEKMLPSKKITAEEYFDGSFGVNHSDDQKPERILIKVYSTQAEYVRALPIHESQKEIEATDEWSIFEYRLVPCFNFYQQLLWHREKLEVLEPLHVREEMKKTIEKMLEHYNSTQRKS